MESQASTSRAAESNSHQYDVFINHRGDVKMTFVSHLDAALRGNGLRPFVDAKDIAIGRHIFNSIREALNGSRVHVAIFSEQYAESRHCLNELCDILESGKAFLPVFYHVKPADLRMSRNSRFKKGFKKCIKHATGEQISKWKQALGKISHYRGTRLDEVNGNEADLVRRILEEVRQLMSNVRQEAAEAPEVGAIEGVEPVPPEATETPELPCIICLKLKNPKRWSIDWWFNWGCIVLGVLMIVASVGEDYVLIQESVHEKYKIWTPDWWNSTLYLTNNGNNSKLFHPTLGKTLYFTLDVITLHITRFVLPFINYVLCT